MNIVNRKEAKFRTHHDFQLNNFNIFTSWN